MREGEGEINSTNQCSIICSNSQPHACTHHTYLAHTDVIWDVQLLIRPQQHLQHLQYNVGYSLQQNCKYNVVTVSQLHMLYHAVSAQLSLLHHEMKGSNHGQVTMAIWDHVTMAIWGHITIVYEGIMFHSMLSCSCFYNV